jgi:hypothetical protein
LADDSRVGARRSVRADIARPNGDKEWVTHTLHVLAWMVPGELALFPLDDIERAKKWAAG